MHLWLARSAFAMGACFSLHTAAQAQSVNFQAALTPANENPPVSAAGSATATLTFDPESRIVTFSIDCAGLSGPPTDAHLESMAGSTIAAVPKFRLAKNPIIGAATLSPQQVDDLQGGNIYLNVVTAANPGGEIRGQLKKAE